MQLEIKLGQCSEAAQCTPYRLASPPHHRTVRSIRISIIFVQLCTTFKTGLFYYRRGTLFLNFFSLNYFYTVWRIGIRTFLEGSYIFFKTMFLYLFSCHFCMTLYWQCLSLGIVQMLIRVSDEDLWHAHSNVLACHYRLRHQSRLDAPPVPLRCTTSPA